MGGRDAALATLRSMLGEGSRTVVVLGMPGEGKTALVDTAVRAAGAEGATVLAICGRAVDRDLAYAALVDLLSLPAGRAVPGSSALLDTLTSPRPEERPPDPLKLRLGVVDWLDRLAGERPVFVAIDDAQWLDPSSRSVLAFVANRLAPMPVSLMVAARAAAPPGLEAHPRLVLDPLDERQARTLLRQSGISLNGFVRETVLARAAGNPLALLELGRIAQGQGGESIRTVEDIPTTVEAAYARELDGLPADTRRLLMLAAAGADELQILVRAVGEEPLMADLAAAETGGFVRVVDRRVRFRHPLARSALYTTATVAERVEAHRQLAQAYVDDPDREVRHRAAATLSADEQVASDLMESAARMRARGAFDEAAQLMVRAADLTPDRNLRTWRMLEAIGTTLPTGNLIWLERLATRLRADSEDPHARARADHFRAYALAQSHQQDAAREALAEALESLIEVDVSHGWASLTTLAVVVYQSGRGGTELERWYQRYQGAGFAPPGADALMVDGCRAWVRTVLDPMTVHDDLVEMVRDSPASDAGLPPELLATHEMLLGAVAWLLDESWIAERRLEHGLALMRDAQLPGQLSQTMRSLAQVKLDLAEYDEADRIGRVLVDLGDAENVGYVRNAGMSIRAAAAAIRGETTLARNLTEEVMLDLDVGQFLALEVMAAQTHAHVLFNEQDVAGSYDQLRSTFHRDGTPVHEHVSYRSIADLVAAAVRAGRIDDVSSVMEEATRRLTRPSLRHQLALARARALLAGEDAEEHHVFATGHPDADQWPFELANARLEYGSWLRRRHRATEARGFLRAAHDVFERLGARAWAELSGSELRASGVSVADTAGSTWDGLTAQERQVVKLAATGMTNREIGASLYLSPRTVGAHLYNAFPKLGVTSRAQLRDIVDARGPAPA
ncbi:MAG TPA: LuxR C-terminal-related transcriptional regulator [Nocardioides sp.]|nr:LuxR C-terminal-related transcriptional regulator [Nocardioides sp.]